jgi:hypothetical protein
MGIITETAAPFAAILRFERLHRRSPTLDVHPEVLDPE